MDITNKSNIKRLEVGKFYFIHDGSKTGHPGYLVWKDDDANRYLFIKCDSDKPGDIPKMQRGVRHITKLSHPTGKNVVNSYARNRPLLCKRKDVGKELSGLFIHPDDLQIIIKLSKKRPEYAPSLKR